MDEITQLMTRLTALHNQTAAPWYPGHLVNDDLSCNCAYIFDEAHMGGVGTVYIDNGKPVSDGGNDAPSRDLAKVHLSLIVEAVNAIPVLVAEIERLRAQSAS